MKLAEALDRYTALEREKGELQKKIEESSGVLLDVGKKVFCLVRKTNGGTGETCQFQVGENQYSVTASGEIKQINVVSRVDGELAIE